MIFLSSKCNVLSSQSRPKPDNSRLLANVRRLLIDSFKDVRSQNSWPMVSNKVWSLSYALTLISSSLKYRPLPENHSTVATLQITSIDLTFEESVDNRILVVIMVRRCDQSVNLKAQMFQMPSIVVENAVIQIKILEIRQPFGHNLDQSLVIDSHRQVSQVGEPVDQQLKTGPVQSPGAGDVQFVQHDQIVGQRADYIERGCGQSAPHFGTFLEFHDPNIWHLRQHEVQSKAVEEVLSVEHLCAIHFAVICEVPVVLQIRVDLAQKEFVDSSGEKDFLERQVLQDMMETVFVQVCDLSVALDQFDRTLHQMSEHIHNTGNRT